MAAKRISGTVIDWVAFGERVSPNQKQFFAAFKSKNESYVRRVIANPAEPPKIDWKYYQARVAVPGLVDSFQKQYDALKVPYPADQYSSTIDSQEKQAMQEVQDFIKESNERIAHYQAEAQKLKDMLPYEQMTLEDVQDQIPELALDTVNKPTFWPHTADEQPDFKSGETEEHKH